MEITPDKRKIIDLVELGNQGKLCLPNFQRSFVWPVDEVADLVRSVLRRYFVGSLLLLRSEPKNPPFDPVFLRGAEPDFREPRPEYLVLDGQQRLTSLLYALVAPPLGLKGSRKRRWFFVDLAKLIDDPDDDEIVFDRTKRELGDLLTPAGQYEHQVLACTELRTSRAWLRWRDGYDDWLREGDPGEHERFRQEVRDRWTDAIHAFQSFEVPVVELPAVDESDAEGIGRVCAIFEKLNSSGVDLSTYDLLTARLYRHQIKLHDLWDQACKDNKLLNEWSEGRADKDKFGILVLRTLALLRGLDPKPRFLINLEPMHFEEDWVRAADALERALELVTHVGQDGLGVFDRKWLPYTGLLPVLGALRAEVEERRLGEGPREDVRRWYWSNVFLERYSSAVESKSRKDYSELLTYWLGKGPEPDLFREAKALVGGDGFSIRDSASYASAVYSGVFCLLALQGARDWKLGEDIQLQELDDHHIFPRAYLRRHGITKRVEVNSITNRTLISGETNRKIRDKAPADYVHDPLVFPRGAVPELLEPHFLASQALDAMRAAEEQVSNEKASSLYEGFRQSREKRILGAIRAACGVQVP